MHMYSTAHPIQIRAHHHIDVYTDSNDFQTTSVLDKICTEFQITLMGFILKTVLGFFFNLSISCRNLKVTFCLHMIHDWEFI